jgi:hypothetical protein
MPDTTESWTGWQHQIRIYLDEHGHLPTLTTEGLKIPFDVASKCWMLAYTRQDQLSSLCRFTDAMGTSADRAAVLLFLARVSNDKPLLPLSEPEEAEGRAAIESLYSDAVSLLPVDQIDTPWRIRWELRFAADLGLWDRVGGLIRHWSSLAPSEEHDALAALARVNFLGVHPGRTADWLFDWWSPYEGSQYSIIGDQLASLFASKLDARTQLDSEPWTLPHALGADEFARVLDAENAIAKLEGTGFGRPMLRLVAAWSNAVIAVRLDNSERLRDAARRYASLARDAELPLPFLDANDRRTRKSPAWSAAMLFRAARDLDSARDMANFWTEVDQNSRDGWKFRAELERQIGLDWFDSYLQYDRLSPDKSSSWEHTELLRLLLESRDRNAADRALHALALEHPDRPVVEEMLTWDWASYSQLHESTREKWWDGLVFVCDERVRKAFRRPPWRYAAACFVESVALELRARVFAPFATAAKIDQQVLNQREWGIATAILNSKATLGTMVEALKLVKDTRSELGQIVNRFLRRRHLPLRSYFQTTPAVERLEAATELRNDAVHGVGDIQPQEAKAVYAEARTFLDMLVKADPRISER